MSGYNRPRRTALRRPPVTALLAALLATAIPASAEAQVENCLTADPPQIREAEQPLRFGITPLAAGNVGSGQLEAKPEDPEAAIAALGALRPPGKQLVMRLNRMFWSDGVAGIRRYARIVDRYAGVGLDSELQVRYHPPEGAEGEMAAWTTYVRKATRILGRRPSVRALSITNEANFKISSNTSDGSYAGVREAVVRGIVAADRELRRIGRRDIELGFSFAWRFTADSDRSFWEEIGSRATPEFRRALDYVGLQVYPGLVWPPTLASGRTAGDEIAEAVTLLRFCYMPKADLGRRVDVWVSENGYATNLGRNEASQLASIKATIAAVSAHSGELGISDYRWFNLRDNSSSGPDLFDAVGLLRDDYTRKPAFAAYRQAIATAGTPAETRRSCQGTPATLIGTPGRDSLRGTRGDDVIRGRGRSDRVQGRGGDDLICGGPGNDRIDGGAGRDEIHGQGGGRDRCAPGPSGGGDQIHGCERP